MHKEFIVKITNLSKFSRNKQLILNNINLSLKKNEGVAFVGPNYSGKTELFKIIARETIEDFGILKYNVVNRNVKYSIGFQFIDTKWPSGYKAIDIINLYKKLYKVTDEEWIEKTIQIFNIEKILKKELNKCHLVDLEIFSLFLAIIHKPELLIINSISNQIGLDEKNNILNFLKTFKENNKTTILINSPDEITFSFLCERLIFMSQGNIVLDSFKQEWNNEISFEDYLLTSLEKIKNKELYLKPEPFLNEKLNIYLRKYENFNNNFKLLNNLSKRSFYLENFNFISFYHNLLFYLEELKIKMHDIVNYHYSIETVKKLHFEIKKMNFYWIKLKKFNFLTNFLIEGKDIIDFINKDIKITFTYKNIIKINIKNNIDNNIELKKYKKNLLKNEIKTKNEK